MFHSKKRLLTKKKSLKMWSIIRQNKFISTNTQISTASTSSKLGFRKEMFLKYDMVGAFEF
jgi:hypothetical protein